MSVCVLNWEMLKSTSLCDELLPCCKVEKMKYYPGILLHYSQLTTISEYDREQTTAEMIPSRTFYHFHLVHFTLHMPQCFVEVRVLRLVTV